MPEAKLDIADELLVAYVDGELDAERRAMVESALERNPVLAQRIEAFVLSRELLREAFPHATPTTPVPAGIRAAMARLADAEAQPSQRVVTAQFGDGARLPRQGVTAHAPVKRAVSSRWMTAIAASLAVCTVGLLTYVAWHAREQQQVVVQAGVGWIERDNPLYAVLESAPSARTIALGGQHQGRGVLTFRARDGRYCREFEVIAGATVSSGLACRSQGHWRTEILLSGTASGADAGQSYQPAAGRNEQAMTAVIERLILGDPLSAAEESRVLSTGWN